MAPSRPTTQQCADARTAEAPTPTTAPATEPQAKTIWNLARKASGSLKVRFHDLKQAHAASWLIAGGADLQVKERLGHASIATTEKCLYSLGCRDRRVPGRRRPLTWRGDTPSGGQPPGQVSSQFRWGIE
jgi:integrase